MTTRYILEINEPNDPSCVLKKLESETPFMAISAGDIIKAHTLDSTLPPNLKLEVTSVEHILWERGGKITHQIVVFTQADGWFRDFSQSVLATP